MNRIFVRFVIGAALLNGAACVSMTTPRFMQPAPQREWRSTLDDARSLASAGEPHRADSVLARYAQAYPGSEGARESQYWRALIQLESGIVSENGPAMLLSAYLSQPNPDHPIEAAALHRVATRVDSLSRAANAQRVQVSNGDVVTGSNRSGDAKPEVKVVTVESKDQEAENRKLRAELAAAKEELERIKKRLAEPPKKPPVR